MPSLFLSPSTQDFNSYVTTGNEKYWMNLLADELEPLLRSAGVTVTRNDPNLNAAAAIRASNEGENDFHLSLHSNASGVGNEGETRGIDLYHYPTSRMGKAMAELLVEELKKVYPLPDLVRALPTTAIGEVRRTAAPAVLAELGYHDNPEDAVWIEENLPAIAQAITRAVTRYFGIS
ncbi:MAG: N-acetylmuramoyl-L-alanine amidase [Oscillospiraceae bacterium]|nr:N-acetylmuramoyl-L-alanine amidase [Oscillospiraceae bacterium]MBR2080836.1 N-acetylmuramoyl-L-alanine amidase [Oscillospiraceae bacterium]MBR2366815.1 N-acetylmuramoyl-L-alanine amidase [Oscillospiraceae bacterium]MBR2897584.1 N-acetylmuramoyl-L-alanine amidase [Oscillospiraceae bacterium]MBR2977235.1 N-acetylmuramoyl-L-alanine amidase [Oscillospiraceae bacterium]